MIISVIIFYVRDIACNSNSYSSSRNPCQCTIDKILHSHAVSIHNKSCYNCIIPNDLAHLTFEVQLTYIAYEIHSERNQCFISFGIFIIFIACMIYSSNVDILDFFCLWRYWI